MGSSMSSMWGYHPASNLLNGKGLDGSFGGDRCVATNHGANQWISFELADPRKLSRVQIAPRRTGGLGTSRSVNILVTIGPSESYDANEPSCLPMIPVLNMDPGLTDYKCIEPLHEGKYVKFSRGLDGSDGIMDFCEVKIFTIGRLEFSFN